MIKYHVISLFVAFLIFYNSALAQSNIGFGSNGIQHQDTLYIGDTIHFNFWLINQGNSILNDSISVNCETFDISWSSISSMSIGSLYNTSGSLAVGDSIHITISEVVTYQSYVLGDNIVVIWPASIVPGSVDTSITYVHILDSLSSNVSLDGFSNVKLIPNPVSENLYFHYGKNIRDCSILIYDSNGRIIFDKNNVDLKYFVFNVNALKNGTYFLVINKDNKNITFKSFVVKKYQ